MNGEQLIFLSAGQLHCQIGAESYELTPAIRCWCGDRPRPAKGRLAPIRWWR
jgi:hypothetical protein